MTEATGDLPCSSAMMKSKRTKGNKFSEYARTDIAVDTDASHEANMNA